MDDNLIIDLYWARSEDAIGETDKKYGSYLGTIAYNILYSHEDAGEAVNDTYLRAWDSMPPERPNILSAYLGKITRRISLNKRRDRRAEKRGGGEIDLVLDELAESLPSKSSVEEEVDAKALGEVVNRFLGGLKETERDMFLRRYWYMDSISDIAAMFGCGESKVKTTLFRIRQKLLAVMESEDGLPTRLQSFMSNTIPSMTILLRQLRTVIQQCGYGWKSLNRQATGSTTTVEWESTIVASLKKQNKHYSYRLSHIEISCPRTKYTLSIPYFQLPC